MEQSGAIAKLLASDGVFKDCTELARLGGRLVGSPSEVQARELLRAKLAAIRPGQLGEHRFEYEAWTSSSCRLELLTDQALERPCHPLYWSMPTPPGGIESEIVDVGRGTLQDFEAAQDRIPGRIVLVRHEYPFARDTIHRRVKYNWSRERKAAGFIIANNLAGELLVTGSCGQDSPENIPGIGVSRETGELLAGRPAVRARIRHLNARQSATGTNLVLEIPGRGPEWVVLCAHYDGHDLAQSALDNATGAAVAVGIARAFSATVPDLPRGLRVILFTAEESGLLGSRLYVASLSSGARRRIALAISLDTIAGSARFGGLVSGFSELGRLVEAAAERTGVECATILPPLRNSDHFSFAAAGVPALRLVAGFDDPDAATRFLLTQGDTSDKVTRADLERGIRLSAEVVWAALTCPGVVASHRAPLET